MSINAKWLRVEEHSNAFNYLEMVKYFLSQTSGDPYYWKWVMISLHGAIYGFAVSSVRGTNSDIVLRKDGRLISFNESLKRCQEKSWANYALLDEVLSLTESQKKSINEMKNMFRDEFMHFKPKGWSIEIHGFPLITLDCLTIIRFLGLQTYSGYGYNLYKQRKVKSIV